MSFKKTLTIFTAVLLIISISACGQQGGNATSDAATTGVPAATTAAETTAATEAETTAVASAEEQSDLKRVDLTFYLMGDPANDMDAFYERFDELTLRDFNCTVRFKFSTWTDYASKYNLMLTTDDTIDLTYSAGWLDFNSYAKRDAFEDLTEWLPQYAPNIWALFPAEKWRGVKVDGKIFGVPQNRVGMHQYVFVYREDLRKKYDLPDLSSLEWDVIEEYLKTCLENEPDMQFAIDGASPFNMFIPSLRKYEYFDATGGFGQSRCMAIEIDNPKNSILYFEQPEYVEFANLMKKWCDMGFWSKSVLSDTGGASGQDQFKEGLIAASFGQQLDKASGWGEDAMRENPDWEVGCLPYAALENHYLFMRTDQDLSCVPLGAKNPERALMVLDKMMTDREYYDLTQLGILGLNYEFDEDGYVSTDNIDRDAHSFAISTWAMGNEDLIYPSITYWDGRQKYLDKYRPLAIYDPFDGFVVDITAVQSEFTAINQVREEYGNPIEWGLVDDPAAAVDVYRQKMKDAGIDAFKAEIDRQIAEFVDSQ